MIVTGGMRGDGSLNSTLYVFDPSEGQVESLQIDGLRPRFSHTSHVIGSLVVLVGGVCAPQPGTNSMEPGVSVVDVAARTAFDCQLWPPPLSQCGGAGRQLSLYGGYCHASAVIEKGGERSIVAVGGGGNCFSFGMHVGQKALHIDVRQLQRLSDLYC